MSPYCPTCLGVSTEDEARCPLDQQFLRKRSCQACSEEMYPREVYCANCGALNREAQEVLLLPPEASSMRQLGSFLMDYITLGVLVSVVVWTWNPLLALLLIPICGLLYRALGRCGGRQTFGQALFGIGTVSPDAGPASASGAFVRSLFELLKVPFWMLGRSVEKEIERRSDTLEIKLV